MATQPVYLKRSATPGKIPTTSNLALGEVGINTFDGKAYIKKNDGTESIVELGSGGGYSAPESIVLYNKDNSGVTDSFDGAETRFQLRNSSGDILTVPSALNLAISINGVMQQPNEGTPTSFNGFYVTPNANAGADIVFSTAPAGGAEFFGILGGTFSATGGTSAITYLDDISASFDGAETDFAITKNGSSYTPQFSVAVLVVLGGVVQIPGDAYTITGSTISFTAAPPAGTSFHAIDLKIGPSAEQAITVISTADQAPTDPSDGQLWYDSVGGRVYIYYNDGSTSQWVDASPATIGGTIELDGGSGASPSLTFATDTDTGIYASSANNLAFATAGSGRLFIDENGQVGINNSDPNSRLHVEGEIRSHSGSAYTALVHDGINGSVSTNASNLLLYAGGNNNLILHTNGTNRLTVTGAGNVGIGTGSPLVKLETVSSADGAISWMYRSGTTGGGAQINVSNGLSSTTPIYSFWYNGATGIGNPAVNAISLITANSEKARLTSDGNLGLGTTFPVAKLHVEGDIATYYDSYIGSNLYYSGGWKYMANGNSAAAIKIGSAAGLFEIQCAGANSSGAGAAASPFNAFAINCTSGNVGINESNPTSKLQVNGYTKIGNYGGTFQGLSVVNNGDATVTRVSFLDAINNLGIINSNIFFEHGTDGSSAIQFSTTPAGDRSTDRRRAALRINEERDIEIYQTPGRYSIDTSVSAVTLANNATVDFSYASGMLVVNNWQNGAVSIYLCGGGVVQLVSSVIAQVGSVTHNAGVAGYRFTNNYGSSAVFGFFFVRTRTTA